MCYICNIRRLEVVIDIDILIWFIRIYFNMKRIICCNRNYYFNFKFVGILVNGLYYVD